MLSADAPLHGEDFLVEFFGQPPHALHVVRVGQIEKGLDVELAVAGVAEERGRHLVAFQHVLHAHEEIGQRLRRDDHVFDDRHGAAGALQPIQRQLHLVDQPPEQLPFVVFKRLAGPERQPLLLPQLAHQTMQPAADLQRVLALLLDQQRGLGLGGNQSARNGARLRGQG